jgi:hypothetical protein
LARWWGFMARVLAEALKWLRAAASPTDVAPPSGAP